MVSSAHRTYSTVDHWQPIQPSTIQHLGSTTSHNPVVETVAHTGGVCYTLTLVPSCLSSLILQLFGVPTFVGVCDI